MIIAQMIAFLLSFSVMSNSVTPWTAAHQASLSMGILQARILEWLVLELVCPPPGIFPTQELNLGFPHCKWILYHLSHQGSPKERFMGLIFGFAHKRKYFGFAHKSKETCLEVGRLSPANLQAKILGTFYYVSFYE